MFKIRSRQNQTNKLPVKQPNSSFGFLCFWLLKVKTTLERAGSHFFNNNRILNHKTTLKQGFKLNMPKFMYRYNKQFGSAGQNRFNAVQMSLGFAEPITKEVLWVI